MDPNNSLQGAGAIVSFGIRSFQLQHAQTLESSFPVYNISHCVQTSFIPASTNIRQYPSFRSSQVLTRRAQSVNCRVQDRTDVGDTESFAPKMTTCGTTAVMVRSCLSLYPSPSAALTQIPIRTSSTARSFLDLGLHPLPKCQRTSVFPTSRCCTMPANICVIKREA